MVCKPIQVQGGAPQLAKLVYNSNSTRVYGGYNGYTYVYTYTCIHVCAYKIKHICVYIYVYTYMCIHIMYI